MDTHDACPFTNNHVRSPDSSDSPNFQLCPAKGQDVGSCQGHEGLLRCRGLEYQLTAGMLHVLSDRVEHQKIPPLRTRLGEISG